MDTNELIWNLKRLIRDGFPTGLRIDKFPDQYKKYFQCDNFPAPSTVHADYTNWRQVFQQSQKFRECFKLDKRDIIKVLPNPEHDLKVFFRLVRYTEYLSARQGAKHDEVSDLSESENDEDDEEMAKIRELMAGPIMVNGNDVDDDGDTSLASVSSSSSNSEQRLLPQSPPPATEPPTAPVTDQTQNTFSSSEVEALAKSIQDALRPRMNPMDEVNIHIASQEETGTQSTSQNETLVSGPTNAIQSHGASQNSQTASRLQAAPNPDHDSQVNVTVTLPLTSSQNTDQIDSASALEIPPNIALTENANPFEVNDASQNSQTSDIDIDNIGHNLANAVANLLAPITTSVPTSISESSDERPIPPPTTPNIVKDNAVPGTSRDLCGADNRTPALPDKRKLSEPGSLLVLEPKKLRKDSATDREYHDVIKQVTRESALVDFKQRNLTVIALRQHITVPINWVVFHITQTCETANGRPDIGLYRWDESHQFCRLAPNQKTPSWRNTNIKCTVIPKRTVLHGELVRFPGTGKSKKPQLVFSILDCAYFGGVDFTMLPFEERYRKCSEALASALEDQLGPGQENLKFVMKPYVLLPNVDQIFEGITTENTSTEVNEANYGSKYTYVDANGDAHMDPIHGLLVMRTGSSFGANCSVPTHATFIESLKSVWYWTFDSDACFAYGNLFPDAENPELGRWTFVELMNWYYSGTGHGGGGGTGHGGGGGSSTGGSGNDAQPNS